MRLPRVLSVSLLISMGVVPGLAQSPQTIAPLALPNVFATQPLPGSRIPALDFHALAPNAKDRSARPLNSRVVKLLNPFVFHPNDLYALEAPPTMEARHEALQKALDAARSAAPGTLMAHNRRCYALRDYNFSRVAPESDAMKLSGSSTCEPADQVRLKGATSQAR